MIDLDTIIFAVSALVAVFAAVMMIGQRNPVASVLYFIVSLVAQAVLYVQLGALFLGAILIIVYAGAIMVLFLFVIMLLNLRGGEDLGGTGPSIGRFTKYLLVTLLVVELAMVVKSSVLPNVDVKGIGSMVSTDFGSVAGVAQLLYGKYLYPFELTSILLLAAIVGAVVMAGREKIGDSPAATEPESPSSGGSTGGAGG